MNGPLRFPHLGAVPRRLAACAALLLSLAGRSGAAEGGALLEIAYEPSQSSQVSLLAIKAVLDGQPLTIQKPDPENPPGRPVYQGPLAAGRHRLQVQLTLAGRNPVFSYVEDYHFDMSGLLEFASAKQGTVRAVARVRDRNLGDPSVEWKDKWALELAAVRTVPVPPPGTEEDEPEVTPATATPSPGPKPAATSATCALGPVRFGLARATLSKPARVELDRFAACLSGSTVRVKLVGHCDRRGSDATNLRLGEQRAEAVARYLEQRGLSAGRLGTESRGATEPLCTEATNTCFARNRRVEAVVAP